jgi:hypothetical protein
MSRTVFVIIGYSLPETDEFFKHFYAQGSVGESVLNTVWAIDPDAGAAERFREILGATFLAPECFRHLETTFEPAIAKIREHLGIPSKSK